MKVTYCTVFLIWGLVLGPRLFHSMKLNFRLCHQVLFYQHFSFGYLFLRVLKFDSWVFLQWDGHLYLFLLFFVLFFPVVSLFSINLFSFSSVFLLYFPAALLMGNALISVFLGISSSSSVLSEDCNSLESYQEFQLLLHCFLLLLLDSLIRRATNDLFYQACTQNRIDNLVILTTILPFL